MQEGFFPPTDFVMAKTLPVLPRCGECGLYKTCLTPKMKVDGEGRKKVLVVGEAPGEKEDSRGIPFVGPTGRLLHVFLNRIGVDLRRDCWVTNALICRPPGNEITDTKAVDHCRPNVFNAIDELKPTVILLLGKTPVKSVIGWLWKEDVGALERWVGQQIPSQRFNAWVCPTWHPSHLLRMEKDRELYDLWHERHLRAAFELATERPWEKVPDYDAKSVGEVDPTAAAACLRGMVREAKGPVAFDFETDRLKPDHPDASIFSCAVSDGRWSISYPWYGEAIKATKELLLSPTPKVGWNIKFEDRWCRRVFGRGVRNWVWDGMLAAHVLDNRAGTKSLKFQAFATLGREGYDEAIAPYLKAGSGNEPNRIKHAGLAKVLKYGALDALLTHKIAEVQMAKLGYKP